MKHRLATALGAALALLAGGLIATPAYAAGTEVEPNGSMATATVIAHDTTVSGTAHSSGWSDSDYYAVDLPAAGRVTLNLKFPSNLGTSVAYSVSVYNSTGKELYAFDVNAGQWDGSWLAAKGVFLTAGRNYVEIYGSSSRSSWGATYTLNVGWSAGTVEHEPNSTTATATPLALGASVTGSTLSSGWSDSDYYAVDIPSAGRVKLDLTFPFGLGTSTAYDVEVYNATGTELYAFEVSGGSPDGSVLRSQGVFLPAGRSYVLVYGSDSRASWGAIYTLKVDWAAGTVEREPNNTTATATALALGATISGSALSAGWSDSDYYAVSVPQASSASFVLGFPGDLGADDTYSVTVYGPTGDETDEFDLTGADANKAISVSLPAGRDYIRVYASDSRPSWGKVYTLNVGYSWAAAPAPTITGTAKVGSILTANTGVWSPAPSSLSYQWYRSGQAIAGATGKALTLTGADLGATIKVAVKAVKAAYPPLTRVSASTAGVVAGTLVTATPTIAGTPKVGLTLTASSGSWGPAPVALSYQWYRSGTAITGATGAKYVLVAGDKAKTITVKVTGRKTGYTTATKASVATRAVAAGTLVAPVPAITGVAKVGTVLTAVPGAWGPSPVKLTYRWYRSGTAISKATKSTYKLTKKDKGKKITVKVTGKKAGYTTVTKKSAATAKVKP